MRQASDLKVHVQSKIKRNVDYQVIHVSFFAVPAELFDALFL